MFKQLQKGSKGADVAALQNALKVLGYDVGPLDGVFGAKTETALKAYQKASSVSPDGVLGPWVAEQLGLTVKGKGTIAITAGHNDKDPGAVNGSYREAFIVVEVRNEVAKRLRRKGFTVLTDGEGFKNESLSNAVNLVKQADLGIEFHLNAAANKTAKGVEALSKVHLKGLCKAMCKSTADILKTNVRGAEGGWKPQNSGQHSRLAFCEAGGIVMELFFISNDLEMQTFFDNREALYDAIANDIEKHMDNK